MFFLHWFVNPGVKCTYIFSYDHVRDIQKAYSNSQIMYVNTICLKCIWSEKKKKTCVSSTTGILITTSDFCFLIFFSFLPLLLSVIHSFKCLLTGHNLNKSLSAFVQCSLKNWPSIEVSLWVVIWYSYTLFPNFNRFMWDRDSILSQI